MKNYEIIQLPHAYSFVLGFYGKCSGQEVDSECEPYDMNQSMFRKIVDSVFEVSGEQSGATFSWYKSDLFASDLNHFDELKCGKLYYFVISPGVGRISIPHLFTTTSSDETQTGARIASDCEFIEPTPTPAADCCSDFQNSVTASASIVGSESLNGVKVFGFDFGGRFCYDSLELTYTPSRFNFKASDGDVLGYITTMGNFKNKEVRYTTPAGVCYGGTVETENGFNILTKR